MNKLNKKLFFCFLLLFFVIFASSKNKCNAFSENFNDSILNNSIWDVYLNEGTLSLSGQRIQLSSLKTTSFPLVVSKYAVIPSNGEFVVDFLLKYNTVNPWGTGFSLSTIKPTNGSPNTPLSSNEYASLHFLQVWQDRNLGLVIAYAGNCYGKPCSEGEIIVYPNSYPDEKQISTEDNVVRFAYLDGKYRVFLNGNEVFISELTDIRPSYLWFGNYAISGSESWSNFEIDYIKIEGGNNVSTLILPGMMACWDFGAVLKDKPGDNWRLIPGITDKIYRNLTNSFSDTDQQAQVWCYDWRRPIRDNADTLNAYLDTLTDPPDKINIVGHSMGGLVGRAFAQKYPERINKLITLGSPHDGAVKAYPLWEAGEIWEYSNIEKLLFMTLVSLHRDKLNNEHPMTTVRRLVPSAKELLPTFDFLTNKEGTAYKDVGTHKQSNTTMMDLNSTLGSPLADQIYTITGTGKQTTAGLKTVSIGVPAANWVHQVVGLWEDGEPTHTCPSATCELTGWKKDYSISIIPSDNGDKTVLADSAALDPARNFEVSEEHRNLPANSEVISKVHEYLGTGTTFSGSLPSLPQRFLLFFLRSPANLLITSPSGQQAGYLATGAPIPDAYYDGENKLILIPDYENGKYSLTVTGTDKGEYGLFLGRVDEAGNTDFREYELPTKAGQTDTFSFDSEPDELVLEDLRGRTTSESLETKLREMYGEDRNVHLRLALKFLEITRAALAKNNWLMAGINLRLANQRLEHYFFKASAADLAANWDEAQAVFEDIRDLMALSEHRSFFFPRSKILQKQLDRQINELAHINKRYQKAAEAGKTHDTIKALVFLESGETLEEIQEAIDQHHSGLAEVLLSQNGAMMHYLLVNN